MQQSPPGWNESKALARAVMRDRATRRKWLGRMLMVPLAMLALGLWVIDGWLAVSAARFLGWWAACALATCVVMLFALYDALAVVREEREERDKFR